MAIHGRDLRASWYGELWYADHCTARRVGQGKLRSWSSRMSWSLGLGGDEKACSAMISVAAWTAYNYSAEQRAGSTSPDWVSLYHQLLGILIKAFARQARFESLVPQMQVMPFQNNQQPRSLGPLLVIN